ncbi:MAG: Non-specific serine/threonine protein kinase, partial [Planctomycetaceae bacterium]|nr:Non-specific serine/threonine protein kinase [Planctomycetaceae bacterium]
GLNGKGVAKSGSSKSSAKNKKNSRRGTPDTKVSKTNKPENLSLEEWQRQLRRQFGRDQKFKLTNVGDHPVFSEFMVQNPESRNTYRVAIRGTQPGDNYCSCPDYATNELGTCKHIEFTLGRLGKKRDHKAELHAGYQPTFSEVYVRYGAQREICFRAGQECPDDLQRLANKYFDKEGRLRGNSYFLFEKFLEQSAEIAADLRCYDDALSLIANVRDDQTRRQTIAKAFPAGADSPTFDTLLKVKLYDYQREGALFAAQAGRSLIGDEMGLGKTIQALAAAEILAQNMGVERVLIICPTSLKHQWEREIEKFTSRDVKVIGGLSPDRRLLFEAPSFFKVTNYDTVYRDIDLIRRWAPDLVVLDEAQRIKNWNTRVARSVKQVSSPYAIVLTGTPLENRLEELVSIVQFIDQQRLGPTYRLLHNHQQRDENGKVTGYRDLNKIGESLKPVLIRRQKKDVAMQLPPRLDKNFFVPMSELQLKHHRDNYELVAAVVSKWRRYGFLTESDQRRLMIGLQNMRMSCDSSYLLDQGTDSGVKADEVLTLLEELVETSANKVVIFSQWLRMHALIVRRMKGKPWGHVLFHGGVESSKRKGLVDTFRNDPNCRAFLATDAGGVGLNLQHANVVVNMDLPWNPAVLEQRVGRVYRLGQTQPVSVVNYISQGTIEEGMLGVLQFKKNVFAGVLDGGETNVFMGGSKLKRFMETVDKIAGNITEALPEEAADPELGRSSPTQSGNVSGDTASKGALISDSSHAGHSDKANSSGASEATPAGPQDPLASLLNTGLSLLQQFANAAHPQGNGSSTRPQGIRVDRDAQTGQSFLRLQLPEPEVLNGVLTAVSKLLESLRR